MTGRTKLPNPRKRGEPVTIDWIRSNCRIEVTAVPMTECWTWLGNSTEDGYGRVGISGKSVATHRATFEMAYGPIGDGMQVDHICRSRGCCNPSHLEPVSPRENSVRGTNCKRWLDSCVRCGGTEFMVIKGHSPYGFRTCARCRRARDRINARRYRALRKAHCGATYA